MLKSILSSKSTLRGAIVVLAISVVSAASAEIDLISDGMFSEGASAGVSETIAVPGAIGPWTVTWSSLDRSVVLIGSLWAGPPPGGYSVDLSTAAIGEFYTIPYAGNYELSFWVSGDQQGGLTTKYYSVSVSNPGSFLMIYRRRTTRKTANGPMLRSWSSFRGWKVGCSSAARIPPQIRSAP